MIGEFFGATHDFEYNIGDKLYEFAIMSYEDFDKLKTYNSKVFRTDLLFKSQIGVFIENPKYYAKEFYEDLKENPYTIELILHEFTDNIEKVSTKKHNEYIKYFETIRDLLIENLMEKKD